MSGSDDFTLFLWEPEDNKKPVARMTGILICLMFKIYLTCCIKKYINRYKILQHFHFLTCRFFALCKRLSKGRGLKNRKLNRGNIIKERVFLKKRGASNLWLSKLYTINVLKLFLLTCKQFCSLKRCGVCYKVDFSNTSYVVTYNMPFYSLPEYFQLFTGHQALINEVLFSPDGRIIASASFDKSIKLWDGNTGKYA